MEYLKLPTAYVILWVGKMIRDIQDVTRTKAQRVAALWAFLSFTVDQTEASYRLLFAI